MQEIVLTPSTVALLLLIGLLVALAIWRLVRRGMCDCGDECDSGACQHCAQARQCDPAKGCSAAADAVSKMRSRL